MPDGYKLSDILEIHAQKIIYETSRGNPRKLLQLTRRCCEEAVSQNLPIITGEFVNSTVAEDTAKARRETLREFVQKRPSRCYMLSRIARLQNVAQIKSIDSDLIANCLDKKNPIDLPIEIERLFHQMGFIHPYEPKWISAYREFYDQLKLIGKPSDLYNAFFEEPFYVDKIDVYKHLENIWDLYEKSPTAQAYLNSFQKNFDEILGGLKNLDNRATVEMLWEMIQALCIAIVVANDVDKSYKISSPSEWKDSFKFKTKSHELLQKIEALYASQGHQFTAKPHFEFVRTERNTCLHDFHYIPENNLMEDLRRHANEVVLKLLTRFSVNFRNPGFK